MHDGTTETTTDSVLKLLPKSPGTVYTSGYVVDDDSNYSPTVNAKVVVAYHPPSVASLLGKDTLRAMAGDTARLPWKASDPPDDPDGESVVFRWTADDGRSGTFLPGDTLKIASDAPKLLRVDVQAVDKDSMKSDPATVWVKFMSNAPVVVLPVQGSLLTDSIVKFRWNKGALDSSFEVFLDTLPDPVHSVGKTTRDSMDVRLPYWNRVCYAKVTGRKGGDTASSGVVAFSTPEDVEVGTTLSSLAVDGAAFDTAFAPLDTFYMVHVAATTTTITVNATGSVADQVIRCGGRQSSTSIVQSVSIVTVPTIVPVEVHSRDGSRTRTYRIVVTRDVSDYVKLASLDVTGYVMSPSFHPDSTTYAVSIARGDSAPIVWATRNSLATVTISHNNGTDSWNSEAMARGSDQDTAGILLAVGRTGVVSNTYRIKVRILPSHEARLQNLYWEYHENFSVDSTSLLRNVSEGTDSVWYTPTLREGQSMTIDGVPATSIRHGIRLKAGMNTSTIRVMAADGVTTRTYTIVFYRQPSTQNMLSSLETKVGSFDRVFDAMYQSYRVVLPYELDSASVRATISSSLAGGMRLIREQAGDTDTVALASGAWSPVVRLKANDSVAFKIHVMAEDTTLKRIYDVRFVRQLPDTIRQLSNVNLSSTKGWIYVSDGFSGVDDTLLVASTPYNDSLLMLNASWYDSWKIRLVTASRGALVDTLSSGVYDTIRLKPSDTTRISVIVTAQDSTKSRTCRIKVYRSNPSADSNLASLEGRSRLGLLDSTWTPGSDSVWRLALPYQDSVVTFRPKSGDDYARSIRIGGKAVATATWLADSIRLSVVGDTNRISVVVTAQDTTKTRTYSVDIYRAWKRRNAFLESFGHNTGLLSPSVNHIDTVYALSVASAVTSVTLDPTLGDTDQASFTVNGSATTRTIALGAVGDTTTVVLVVTAQDASVKRTYALRIMRERDPSSLYGTISIDSTLTLANSPYLVDAAVTVKNGVTLTIEPGVRIKFNSGRSLTVKGTLKALGTASQPIVFTRATAANWGYIMFDSMATNSAYDASGVYANGSILQHCVIEYSGNSTMANAAAVYLKKRYPHFESTTIQYSQTMGLYGDSLGEVHWNGLQVKNSTARASSSRPTSSICATRSVSDNGRGLHIKPTNSFGSATEWLKIDTCQFLRNGVTGDAGGAYIGIPGGFTYTDILLRGNLFDANVATGRGGGLYLVQESYDANPSTLLQGNTFRNNQAESGGAVFFRPYYTSSLTYGIRLLGNLIEANTASSTGGVRLLNEYEAGVVGNSYYDSANVYRNNRSTGTGSGALELDDNRRVARIVGSRFVGNVGAVNEGALNVWDASGTAEVLDCRFVGNSGVSAGALRIHVPTTLSGNLFQGNTTSGQVASVLWDNSATGTITNNTFSGNIAPLIEGSTISTNSIVMEVDGFPVLSGNNFLANTTDRILRTSNTSVAGDVDANGNWWGSTSPLFYRLLADKNSDLDGAASFGAFDASTWLSAPNASAPATE